MGCKQGLHNRGFVIADIIESGERHVRERYAHGRYARERCERYEAGYKA